MKQNVIYIYVSLVCLLFGCTDTDVVKPVAGSVGTEEVFATFRFGHEASNPVNVSTRATLGVVPESRVQNLFVYLCVGDNCVYTHYFDKENLMKTASEVTSAKWNCWYVDNMGTGEDPAMDKDATNGVIRMRTADVTGATLYLVANIDADMVNISPEKLNTIRTRQEIENLTATLNQEITSRNGYFPMGAVVRNVSISDNTVMAGGKQVVAELVRLDAKVRVNVRTAIGNVNKEEEGEGDAQVVTRQKLSGFIPESWRVVNLPKGAYVMPYVGGEGARADEDYEEIGYFDTDDVGFEETTEEKITFKNTETGKDTTVTQKTHSFSFYMLENEESANKGGSVGTNYHLRDRRTKDPVTGKYINGGTDGGIWDYAPENSTYLEIKGQIEMVVDVSTSAKQQHLAADVIYYIHLGDFATSMDNSMDNYDISRNTSYTYTITIKGVNSIEVEVKTSQNDNAEAVDEKESGATGQVYVAEEEIFTFDAHYGQRVYMIDAATIDPKNVTWYVSTPFSEGVPEIVGGTEVPAGKDYKWVQFMVNEITGSGESKAYSKNNQSYPGYKGNPNQYERSMKLMDVVEFTKFIKEEVEKMKDNDPNTNSDYFLEEFDQEWFDWCEEREPDIDKNDKSGLWWRDRMYVTIFVDEFYYEVDPITGNERVGLWKEFVNQPNRLMHILCDNQESLDEASSSTGSIVTIRQRSIQTPYNTKKETLQTAWGCEVVDEVAECGLWYYEEDEKFYSSGTTDYKPETLGINNTAQINGQYNTACLWGLIKGGAWQDVYWDTFLDYNRPNDYPVDADYKYYFLRSRKETKNNNTNYKTLRYAPLMRNRDNDGDGKIGIDEVRWYIASIDQLYGLYMGELGLHADAALYSIDLASLKGKITDANHPYYGADIWRRHIISSTKGKDRALVLWGEEGVSTGDYATRWKKAAPYSIRCVRNLGITTEIPLHDTDDNADKGKYVPENLIQVTPPSTIDLDAVYYFDLSNISEKSIRYYTSQELEPSDEHAETARLYYGFKTGPWLKVQNSVNDKVTNYTNLRNQLEGGDSPVPSKLQKDGYRVPNVREGALLYLYCKNDAWWGEGKYTLVSSFYSNGTMGSRNDTESPSWYFSYNNATIGQSNVQGIRTVCDWDPASEE